MFRKSTLVALMIIPAFLAGTVHADFVSGNATIGPPDLNEPITDVITAIFGSGGGTSFTNDFSRQTPPAQVGDTIYAVTADYVTSYTIGNGTFQNADFGKGNTMLVVSTLVGIATSSTTALFTSGQAQLWFDTTTVNLKDPTTWETGTQIATYQLTEPPQITESGPNGALGDNYPTSVLDQAAVNYSGLTTTGQFLFTTVNNGGYIQTNPIPGQLGDGLLAHIQEQLVTSNLTSYNYTGTGQTALNTIFKNGTGIAGAFNNYAPSANGPSTIQLFGVNADPGNFIVPEPASMLLFGLGLLGAAGQGWMARRNRKKVIAA